MKSSARVARLVGAAFALMAFTLHAADEPASPSPAQSKAESADRTEEMLSKMRSAVEEIAELYGNPSFVQIFTNNREMADELRQRLRATEAIGTMKAEVVALAARKESLANEVALKEQEAKRLSERLTRQRAALDSVASAIAATNRAVEGTAP